MEQAPGFLHSQNLNFLMFGGKGGVGKTTAATASALYLASRRAGERVLIISTDPAHSLGDSFGQEIGDNITPVKGVDNLSALEIDAPRRLEEFKAKYREELESVAYRGTIFDRDDIKEFLSLSLPGMDEMMAVFDIGDIIKDIIKGGEYGLVILDTAPTGHTIRLLELPDVMLEWIKLLKLMQERYRYIGRRLTGRYPKDKVDDFLAKLANDVHHVKNLLTNKQATEFVPVTIAEDMAIEETQRLLDVLQRLKISVKTILVNRVAEDRECPFCTMRWSAQKDALSRIEQTFSNYQLVEVPLLPHEVKGIERLKTYAQVMLKQEVPEVVIHEVAEATAIKQSHWHDLAQVELILFGGKGGVGKTTSAAAIALYLTSLDKEKKTLVFSTDPAHSLGDSFDQEIGDKVTPISGVEGLFALEIEPARLLEEFKEEYRESIDEAFDTFLKGGMDIPYDRAIMEELIESTPPGVDELMGMMKIMDFMELHEFDRYILDMAPTGHALHFLELPDMIREWFKTIFRLLLKYKGVSGSGLNKTAELTLKRSRQLRLVETALRNPQRCQFVCVTIPEAMSLAETRRLVQRLSQLRIACREVIVNMVIPPTRCPFCSAKRSEQQSHLKQFEALGLGIHQVPLFSHQIVGIEALSEIAETIYGNKNDDFPQAMRASLAGSRLGY